MPSVLCFDSYKNDLSCSAIFFLSFLGFLCKRKLDRLPQLFANLSGGSGSKAFVVQPLLAHGHPRRGKHLIKTLLLPSGVCDRDDHEAGGEEQEEGTPVLA